MALYRDFPGNYATSFTNTAGGNAALPSNKLFIGSTADNASGALLQVTGDLSLAGILTQTYANSLATTSLSNIASSITSTRSGAINNALAVDYNYGLKISVSRTSAVLGASLTDYGVYASVTGQSIASQSIWGGYFDSQAAIGAISNSAYGVGAVAGYGQTTYGVYAIGAKGTTNYGVYSNASNGTTNYGVYTSATFGATNNYSLYSAAGVIYQADTTDNTLGSTDGSIQTAGGVGIAKNLTVGTGLTLNEGTFTQTFTGTTTNAHLITANSLTTGKALAISANALTSGNAISALSTSTGRITASSLLSIASSGVNASSSIEARGISSTVVNTGTTSINTAIYSSASGASTNYSFYGGAGTIYNLGPVSINGSSSATVGGLTNISAISSNGIIINGNHGGNDETGISFQSYSGGGAAFTLSRGVGYDTNLCFYTNAASNASAGGMTERMRIDSLGNVGIGVSSLSSTLDIASSSGKFIRMTNSFQISSLEIPYSASGRTFKIRASTRGLRYQLFLIDCSSNYYNNGGSWHTVRFAVYVMLEGTNLRTNTRATNYEFSTSTSTVFTFGTLSVVSGNVVDIPVTIAANFDSTIVVTATGPGVSDMTLSYV